MADVVSRQLESQLPEFQQYIEYNIFTVHEVKLIIKQRTIYEYKLNKKYIKTQPIDYINYINYELNINQLRIKRKHRFNISDLVLKQCDYSHIKHIMFIYERLCKKYSFQLKYWLMYIDYMISTNNYRQTAQLYIRALQLHPNAIHVWRSCILYQYNQLNDMDTARILCQRAIRMNQKLNNLDALIELYLTYFQLEIQYSINFIQRRLILGVIDKIPSDAGDNDDNVMSLTTNQNTTQDDNKTNESSQLYAIKHLLLPRHIYKQACTVIQQHHGSTITDKTQQSTRFLQYVPHAANTYYNNKNYTQYDNNHDVYSHIEFEPLINTIIAQLIDVYGSNSSDVYAIQAQWIYYHALHNNKSKNDALQSVCSMFDSAIHNSVQSQSLYTIYTEFIYNLFIKTTMNDEDIDYTQLLLDTYLSVIDSCINNDKPSQSMYIQCIELLLKLQQYDYCVDLCHNAIESYHDDAGVYALYLRVYTHLYSIDPQTYITFDRLVDLHRTALNSLPPMDQHMIYRSLIELMRSNDTMGLDNICKVYEESIVGCTQHTEQFKTSYLKYVCSQPNINCRVVQHGIQYCINYGVVTLQVLYTCIDALNYAYKKSNDTQNQQRVLYERCVSTYGADTVDCWVQYIKFELKYGLHRVHLIQQRALNTLKPDLHAALTSQLATIK